jgi:cyclophilin family peptidyl-prolyl cis-trans isomerase
MRLSVLTFPGALFCLGAALSFGASGVRAAEEVKASHILVADQEEAAKIRKEVLANGGDRKAFSAAARKYSKDVTTKTLGGNVDWFSQSGNFDRAFADSAFKMKIGEISEPVKSSFGWHLIMVTDRRDKGAVLTPPPPPPPPDTTTQNTAPAPNPKPPVVGQNDLIPRPPTPNPGDGKATGTELIKQAETTKGAPPVLMEGKRRVLGRELAFRVSLETTKTSALSPQQFVYRPLEAVEINVSVKNEGSKEQKFFARELLPLGLRLTPQGESPVQGDFSSVPEPASYFVTLKTYEIIGLEVSINDYFKNLTTRRYGVKWDVNLFLNNLETRFPKVKELPEYAGLAEGLKKPNVVASDVVVREVSPRITYQRNRDLAFGVFEELNPQKKYYAQLKLGNEQDPVVIELFVKEQLRAVQHFVNLVLDGFYDGLDIFDSEEGDYLLAGCPIRTGTGAPSGMLPLVRNTAKLEHKRGTVSFVSRSVRQKGPMTGGQIGSIFMFCLKPHPEWNEEHVPIGQVVSGMEVLEKKGRSNIFREITILTEDQLKGLPAAAPGAQSMAGNPEAVLKTSKGNLTVELFEDIARNTVGNFVELADQGFFNKTSKGDGKQKFFNLVKDAAGKPQLIVTGSPNNEGDGGPGHYIRDEINPTKKFNKGALFMLLEYDEQSKNVVPATAGSQFVLCLQDLPAAPPYEFDRKYTIFAQVTGGLEVLEKLQDGDTLESVEITKKKNHPYKADKIAKP